jgi:hypothetical protein
MLNQTKILKISCIINSIIIILLYYIYIINLLLIYAYYGIDVTSSQCRSSVIFLDAHIVFLTFCKFTFLIINFY